jgi:hypothetical protein
MRYLLIFSILLFGCNKEEAIIKKPYQLRMASEGSGYKSWFKDMHWFKEVNLNNKIFIDMGIGSRLNDYEYDPLRPYEGQINNFQTFDIDIEKLSDTTNVRVILTFDCDTATIIHELYGLVRDGIPESYDIKEEAMINFYKDKRTVILVEASPVCNPEISVFYE